MDLLDLIDYGPLTVYGRCEKCAQDLDNFKWRLMLSLSLADYSDTVWATCFQVREKPIASLCGGYWYRLTISGL